MTTSLERPTVETKEPLPKIEETEKPRRPVLVRWISLLATIAVVIGLIIVGAQFRMDPSYGIAEQNRFEATRLLSADLVVANPGELNRFEATRLLSAGMVVANPGELNRFEATRLLAGDTGISDPGELNRFEATRLLVPEAPTGYDLAELNRFQALQDLTPTA